LTSKLCRCNTAVDCKTDKRPPWLRAFVFWEIIFTAQQRSRRFEHDQLSGQRNKTSGCIILRRSAWCATEKDKEKWQRMRA
jgi:hypothetical protein